MDKIKKTRAVLRTAFTKALNNLHADVHATVLNAEEVAVSLQLLETKFSELEIVNQQLFSSMVETNMSEEEIAHELETADEYKVKFIRERNRALAATTPSTTASNNMASERKQKTFKLPKIELKKFNGDVKEWLQFWSLFKKIHEDVDVAKEDKFQYLIQAMVPKSRAYELVQSFPPTSENYDKVIVSLKTRFGRDELLVEVYVRELLKLVLQNAMKPNEKTPLSSLYDKIESQLRALETLGVTTAKCASMLFPLVESSLPEDLLRAWQRSGGLVSATATTPDGAGSGRGDVTHCKDRLTLLMEFLQSEVENEQRIAMAVDGFDLKDGMDKTKKPKARTDALKDVPSATDLLITGKSSKEAECVFCGAGHESSNCDKARKMSLSQKQDILKEKNACFNCLRIGHSCKKCRVNVKCAWCRRKHVVLMCPELLTNEAAIKKVEPMASTVAESNLANFSHNPEVLLQTLRVKLRNDKEECVIRAIIDTGSQKSYILKQAARKMDYLPISEHRITHSLFGGVKSEPQDHRCYHVRLGSLDGKYACRFKALDQDVICGIIPSIQNGPWYQELDELDIEPVDVGSETPIQVLIGADIAGKLLTGRHHLLKCGLVAVETLLGWTLMGKIPQTECREDAVLTINSMFVKEANVSDLWELDALGIKDPVESKTRQAHEEEVHQTFLKTVVVNDEKRYEVQLPWLENHPPLNDNRQLACKRLESTKKKLEADGLFTDYDKVLEEWKEEGIIEEVPEDEVTNWGHYLPHRHVVKENSTTRIRPVFDASARDRDHPSLNQCLETGPNLIELIDSILLRFRKGNIGVISDIRKAFLQISIDAKDRDWLRFLWYKNDTIVTLRHTRVVFGVSCSPFLLNAVISLHLQQIIENERNGLSAKYSQFNLLKLAESFYVDNCVTSVNSLPELTQFITDAKAAMEEGRFDLRGWEFTDDEAPAHQAAVLGIIWNKQEDTLSLSVPSLDKFHSERVTKRSILSLAHRVFDPLGFACPIMLCPKLLLQETWASKIPWDDEVSEEIGQRFLNWVSELRHLHELQVPRCMLGFLTDGDNVSLHTFCDASQVAYAAVVFVRIENSSGVRVHFVQAKARIATVKRITIPRLELMAATIAARLSVSVLETLGSENVTKYFWSDSTTVLAWIQRQTQWCTFVWNRVQEIRRLTNPDDWRHVPGTLNPADLPSRGCTVRHLVASRWWEGPKWLSSVAESWPMEEIEFNEEEVDKEKRKSTALTTMLCTKDSPVERDQDIPWYAEYFSNYSRIIRLIGWIRRFAFNSQRKEDERKSGELSAAEVRESELTLLRILQEESFSSENDERLASLSSIKGDDGLIRIKTKIILRDDTHNFRYPIVLPARHLLTQLIIREKHENLAHAGVQILMSNLREDFWILGGRRTIRAVIGRCVVCRRHESKAIETAPAALPMDRVRDAAVFEVTGVDLAGPVFLKGSSKAWIVLFTCAVYRAVHLELASSLSTMAFLEALRRFITRKGRPSIIYSDNGKNFVGLNNLLQQVDWEKVSKFGTVHKIEWKFNPPTAAWWGGWWERLIGLLKRLLRRVLGKACLTYEEMTTVLCDCESVINSRPITFMSDHSQDLVPLTPLMFLQDLKEVGVLDLDCIEETNLEQRYLYRLKIKEDLRSRFRSEYLGELVHRCDKNKLYRPIQKGDIVLVGNDNTKRLKWPLARVKEVIVGKDNVPRVVKLITSSGELVRPVQRVFPLELRWEQSEVLDQINDNIKSKIPVKENVIPVKENVIPVEENVIPEKENVIPDEGKIIVTRTGRIIKKPEKLTL